MVKIKSNWVKLSDGSSFPLALSLDPDEYGIEWRLRYAPDSITRGDLFHLAAIVSAYNVLIYESNREKRDLVSRDMKQAMNEAMEEATNDHE